MATLEPKLYGWLKEKKFTPVQKISSDPVLQLTKSSNLHYCVEVKSWSNVMCWVLHQELLILLKLRAGQSFFK